MTNSLKGLAALLLLMSAHQVAGDEIPASLWEELKQSAVEMNANAPTKIDTETEFLLLTVNCVGNMVSYTKRLINFHSNVMLDGWQDRKQLSHTQLHCNRDGLATAGIAVMDTLHNPDGSFAAKFVTSPDDCEEHKLKAPSVAEVENFGIKRLELGRTKKEVEAYLDAYPLDCQDVSKKAEDCKELSISFTVAGYLCYVNQLLFWSDAPLDASQKYMNFLERQAGRIEPFEDKSKLYSAKIVCGDSNGLPALPSSQASEQAQSDNGNWELIEAALTKKYGEPNRLADSVFWSNNKQRIELKAGWSVELELFDEQVMQRREADDALRERQRIQDSLEDI